MKRFLCRLFGHHWHRLPLTVVDQFFFHRRVECDRCLERALEHWVR